MSVCTQSQTAKAKWGDGDKTKADTLTCSLVSKPDIYLELKARQKIALLMEEYTNREWLAYMVGRVSEAGNYFVEDIHVPPHKESYYASAEAEPFNVPDHCVGVIHSHHGMGAFHSGTDDSHVDRNFDVSVVVARGQGALTYNGVSRAITLCGKIVLAPSNVIYLQPEPQFDAEAWLKEAKEEIDKGERKATTIISGGCINQGAMTKALTLPETKVGVKQPEQAKPSVAFDKVVEMQNRILDHRGIKVTRSEIEDAMSAVPEGIAWYLSGGED